MILLLFEMKEEKDDNSYKFLEFDDNILEDYGSAFIGNSVYIIHYPSHFEDDKVAVSFGIIKGRYENVFFKHFCSTEFGSSGSPILNLINNKVIGIHSKRGSKEFNIGLFVYESIKDFINKYNIKINEKNKKKK